MVHPSFCGIVIHYDFWFLMFLASDSPISMQHTHEYHIFAFLWHVKHLGHVGREHKLKGTDRPEPCIQLLRPEL